MFLDVHIHKEAKYFIPYLDGEYLKKCFAANEEENWADCHATDENGKILINETRTETIKKRFHGRVKLVDTRISSRVEI